MRELPSHDRIYKVPIDPMHLIKNIVSHCVHLITGVEDSAKVHNEEESRQRFRGSWVTDSNGELPSAPFCLNKEDIQLADERAKPIYVPHGFDWRPREFFKRTSGMKSITWVLWNFEILFTGDVTTIHPFCCLMF